LTTSTACFFQESWRKVAEVDAVAFDMRPILGEFYAFAADSCMAGLFVVLVSAFSSLCTRSARLSFRCLVESLPPFLGGLDNGLASSRT